MAKIIKDFTPKERSSYPWDVWTDGQARLIERGVDYTVSDNSFRAQCHTEASKRGLKAVVETAEGGLNVKFYVPNA